MKTKTQFTNRILSFMLTIVMVLGMLPMTAHAAAKTSVTIADLSYTLTVKSATDKKGNDILSSITISLDEKNVGRTGNTVKISSMILYGFGTGFSCEFTDTDCAQGLSVDREFVLGNDKTGYQKAVVTISRSAASHIGGTCTSPTCTRCGKTYDAPHDYNTWKNNGTSHWQECTYDVSHTTGYGTCSGGTATCHDLATCSTCNLTYGQVDPDNHVWTKWKHGDSVHSVMHYRTCQYCVDVEQREYCYPRSNCTYKAQCETCKTYLALDLDAHSWGSWKSNGDNTHTRTCTINSSHTETQDCSGDSSATCTIEGTCTICGGKYTNLQAHNLSYTVATTGNIITEKCDNGCGHTATATLDADEAYIYTGSSVTPATINYSENWQGDTPTDISYVNNVDAGTATATITVEGQTLTKNFQIQNAYSVSFNANGGSGEKDSVPIMDGEEYTLPANPFTALSGYQFKGWATSQNGNVLQDEKITMSENVTLYAIWEKIPAEMPTVAVSENLTLTYGEYTDQKFTATVEKKDGYTYEYQWIDGNTVISNTDTLEIPDDLAAGVYDYYLAVGAKRTDNGEIIWYTNPNLLVKVNPKELDASNVTLSQDTFTYDGKEQIPTVTVKVGGKTLTEYTDYDVILPSDCKNVGTKTITVTFRGNYSGSAQVDYEIEEKEIGISWEATLPMPYNGESKVPNATATGLVSGDTCTLTTDVVETDEGAGIIPGTWTAKVVALSNSNYKLPESGENVSVTFEIVNGSQDNAPVVSGVNETISGKADGKITGVDSTMEYRKDGESTYTAISGTEVTDLAVGTYYVRYAAKQYYNASPDTAVTVAAGRKLTVTVPQNQVGYTMTTTTPEVDWFGSISVEFKLLDGYSMTDDFQIFNGTEPVGFAIKNGVYVYKVNFVIGDYDFNVRGIADITPPAVEISVKENKWASFFNGLTFGLFFKETQDVTITATDVGSGVKNIQYYLSDRELELDEVKSITSWIDYNGTFKIDPDNNYVVYAKVTDNDGNVAYINSEGIVLDATTPVISGVENGKTYYTTQKVTVTDKNIGSITLNGETAGNEITLEGNKEATYTIVATDKAGNSTTVTVTMKPISDLSAPIETLTKDNVNSSNSGVINEVKADVAAVDTTNATDAEKQALKDITDKAAELEKVINDTKAEIARINEELNKYDDATVNSDDAAALEQLGKDINALTDGNNLTDAERAALTEDANDVAALQKIVSDTVAENDRISDAVDSYDLSTVTSDDKDDLEQLLADIEKQLESTNLTAEEISELNGEKKAVEDLLTKIKGTDELIDKLTGDVDGYNDDTVKSTDKDAIEQIIEDIDALLETENLTEDEKQALEDTKAKAEDLLDTIEDAAKAPNTENTEKVKDVTSENVTPEEKTDLEKAKADLEKALEVGGGNYTEDEKKAIEDEIKRIDDALEVIGKVEAVEELIDKLPENIKGNDEDAIKAADDAYNALSDYEKSLVDEAAKKALDDAKAALAELNKPAAPNSPATGDNSSMFLWIALLFISGGAVITLTVVERKKRMAKR